jgi:hypothetical protein
MKRGPKPGSHHESLAMRRDGKDYPTENADGKKIRVYVGAQWGRPKGSKIFDGVLYLAHQLENGKPKKPRIGLAAPKFYKTLSKIPGTPFETRTGVVKLGRPLRTLRKPIVNQIC